MSNLFKQYKTDSVKENKGVAIEFPEAMNDDETIPTFYITRMNNSNKRYAKALELASKPHRRSMQLNVLSEEVAGEMLMGVFCSTILVGWENVRDENDEVLEFSRDNALMLMKELPEIYNRLNAEANTLSNFKALSQEEELKN